MCFFFSMWKCEILPASLGIGNAKAKNKPFSVLNNRASSFLYKRGLGSCFLCLPRVGYLLASVPTGLFSPLRVEAGLEKVKKRQRFVADLAMFMLHRTNYTVCLVLITTSVTARSML